MALPLSKQYVLPLEQRERFSHHIRRLEAYKTKTTWTFGLEVQHLKTGERDRRERGQVSERRWQTARHAVEQDVCVDSGWFPASAPSLTHHDRGDHTVLPKQGSGPILDLVGCCVPGKTADEYLTLELVIEGFRHQAVVAPLDSILDLGRFVVDLMVALGESGVGILFVFEGDEAKAPWYSCVAVVHDLPMHNGTELRKVLV